jgi:hypothetical protein
MQPLPWLPPFQGREVAPRGARGKSHRAAPRIHPAAAVVLPGKGGHQEAQGRGGPGISPGQAVVPQARGHKGAPACRAAPEAPRRTLARGTTTLHPRTGHPRSHPRGMAASVSGSGAVFPWISASPRKVCKHASNPPGLQEPPGRQGKADRPGKVGNLVRGGRPEQARRGRPEQARFMSTAVLSPRGSSPGGSSPVPVRSRWPCCRGRGSSVVTGSNPVVVAGDLSS